MKLVELYTELSIDPFKLIESQKVGQRNPDFLFQEEIIQLSKISTNY